jgi:hypothetical protein
MNFSRRVRGYHVGSGPHPPYSRLIGLASAAMTMTMIEIYQIREFGLLFHPTMTFHGYETTCCTSWESPA